jgi:hypothetical protein
MLKIKEAIEELKTKSYNDVQTETAYKWASRACAAYALLLSAEFAKKVAFWTMAEEYGHEAIEHAALTADNPSELVAKIQKELVSHQSTAAKHMSEVLSQDLG